MSDAVMERIRELKAKRNAVILAHNYQLGEVQDAADWVGDSLELARKAAASDADVIVFCGVHFMAETAAILAPDKKVLLPEPSAGCPMADMADAKDLAAFKAEHPGAAVVAYVNSSAAVKALTDVCCTSANAIEVVQHFPKDQEIIFVPDKHLGSYVARRLGREILLWNGFCPSHMWIRPEDIERRRKEFPDAVIMVHPECRPEVVELADEVLGTGGMCRMARESDATTFVIGTEVGLIHRLKKENPDKRFVAASEQAICMNMKKITLDSVVRALDKMDCQVTVEPEVREKALGAVERMVQFG
ncbi:MAG: quinolinate synthase NadA [Deltaproteobacteria bacterium]|nr:quinolinate synthase NadA [Deltaproteobacteria bacterium]